MSLKDCLIKAGFSSDEIFFLEKRNQKYITEEVTPEEAFVSLMEDLEIEAKETILKLRTDLGIPESSIAEVRTAAPLQPKPKPPKSEPVQAEPDVDEDFAAFDALIDEEVETTPEPTPTPEPVVEPEPTPEPEVKAEPVVEPTVEETVEAIEQEDAQPEPITGNDQNKDINAPAVRKALNAEIDKYTSNTNLGHNYAVALTVADKLIRGEVNDLSMNEILFEAVNKEALNNAKKHINEIIEKGGELNEVPTWMWERYKASKARENRTADAPLEAELERIIKKELAEERLSEKETTIKWEKDFKEELQRIRDRLAKEEGPLETEANIEAGFDMIEAEISEETKTETEKETDDRMLREQDAKRAAKEDEIAAIPIEKAKTDFFTPAPNRGVSKRYKNFIEQGLSMPDAGTVQDYGEKVGRENKLTTFHNEVEIVDEDGKFTYEYEALDENGIPYNIRITGVAKEGRIVGKPNVNIDIDPDISEMVREARTAVKARESGAKPETKPETKANTETDTDTQTTGKDLFDQPEIETEITVYRAVTEGATENKAFEWVALDEEVAKVYASQSVGKKSEVVSRKITKPKKSFILPYKNPLTDVRADDIVNNLTSALSEHIGEMSEDKMRHIMSLIEQFRELAGDNLEKWHAKINKPESGPMFARILQELGYDSVIVYEGKKQTEPTYGLIRPQQTETQEETARPEEKIEDFGEKIGGARKDLAKEWTRKLDETSIDDIKIKPLSKVFPLTEIYRLLEEESISLEDAVLLKFLHEQIGRKPGKNQKRSKLEGYVREVTALIGIAKLAMDVGGQYKLYYDSILKNETARLELDTYKNVLNQTGVDANLGGHRVFYYAHKDEWIVVRGRYIISDGHDTVESAAQALVNIIDEGSLKRRTHDIRVFYKGSKDLPGSIFIGKKIQGKTAIRLKEGFRTLDEAEQYLRENRNEIEKTWEDMNPKIIERPDSNKPRKGTDWRSGKNVTPKQFQDTFGFRGIEFGNWLNQIDRQSALNRAFDALMDLAFVTGVSPKALSLNGELALAFGARGKAGANAHYEPGKVVINLTKEKGAGSLAHEWWHALDNYFARDKGLDSDFVTKSSRARGRMRVGMAEVFENVVSTIGNMTSMKQRSRRIDSKRKDNYWSTPEEMTARAFEQWVIHRLHRDGDKNDYLSNFSQFDQWIKNTAMDGEAYPYLKANEEQVVFDAFEEFFHTIGEDEVSKKRPLFSLANNSAVPQKSRDEKLQDEIDQAKLDFRKATGYLNSTGLNPKMIEAGTKILQGYMKAGIYKFEDMVAHGYKKYGDGFRKYYDILKGVYNYYMSVEATEEELDKMEFVDPRETLEVTRAKNKKDVSDRTTDSEPDSPKPPTEESGDERIVPRPNRGGRGSNRGTNTGNRTGTDRSEPSSEGNRDLFSPPIGERSDNDVDPTDRRPQPPSDRSGTTDGRGDSHDGTTGSDADIRGDNDIDTGVKKGTLSFAERAKLAQAEQKLAEKIPIKIGDEANIRETLPMLLPLQQDDVVKAEDRFFNEKHNAQERAFAKGMMFTNATGTGKTFTALGVIKRMARQGKKNILIITPTQPNVKNWRDSGAMLMLNVEPLVDTSDGGNEISVTTFANFRANEELLKRDFDLIVYDESHRLLEAKDGTASTTTEVHSMMANKSEAKALQRLKTVHPLWKRQLEIDRILGLKPDELQELVDNGDVDIQALRSELIDIQQQQREALPAMQIRAAEAHKRTKVLFLSATPFKHHKNIRYANGFLWDWGEEEETNAMGSNLDAESIFMLKHFGAAYEWKYRRLQERGRDGNPLAIARQEVAFAEWMRGMGTMSGRMINSQMDYSREFPKVTGFNSQAFNEALMNVFSGVKYAALFDYAKDVWKNYNYSTQLFESLKASMIIPRLQKHLDLGRKIVVFHRRRQAYSEPPFALMIRMARIAIESGEVDDSKAIEIEEAAAEFELEYGQLFEYEQTLNYDSAIDQIEAAFPNQVGYINGSITKKTKNAAIKQFNDDDSGLNIIVVQEEAGKEGISLHDTTGKFQRVLMSLSIPVSTTTALQVEGRIFRLGQETNAIFEYPILGLHTEIMKFGNDLNNRLSTTENMSMGELSRDLMRSFSEGVLFNSTEDDPGVDQGAGGKDFDKRQENTESEFERARITYAGNQKTRGKRTQRQGYDYFPTPEPLGQKMVEWAKLISSESALEPSAGNGAIAMWIPQDITRTVIEPSFDLFSTLGARTGGSAKTLNENFEAHNIVNKYEAVIMNPPYGTGGKLAAEHLEKAFKHIRDGGRIVAILPDGPAMERRIERFFTQKDKHGKVINSDAHLRQVIKLPRITFTQAGTAVATQVVIIDKSADPNEAIDQAPDIDLTKLETIDELFDAIENIESQDRPNAATRSQGQMGRNTGGSSAPLLKEIRKDRNTRTNEEIWIVPTNRYLTGGDYQSMAGFARRFGGYWSRFPGKKGFHFKSENDASRFVDAAMSWDQEKNAPKFSFADDTDAASNAIEQGIDNPHAPIVIRLTDAGANESAHIKQYAGVWLDTVEGRYKNFVNRGLDLIKGTQYDKDYDSPREALEAAISDRAEKLVKTPKLLAWVRLFWKRVGRMLHLSITPEQLAELTVGEYLDIAATSLRYSNDIYGQLGADTQPTPTDPNDNFIAKRTAELEAEGVDMADGDTSFIDNYEFEQERSEANRSEEAYADTEEEAYKGDNQEAQIIDKYSSDKYADVTAEQEVETVDPANKNEGLTEEEVHVVENRNQTDIGKAFVNPNGPTAQRLLGKYSGDHKKLIESALLLFPTLKEAGITLTFHETNDSFYNAALNNGGSYSHALKSFGFFNNNQVHINLARPDLKANVALHEGLHPVIGQLLSQNPHVFNQFIQDILNDPYMAQKYFDSFAEKYYNHLSDVEMEEEAMVEATADIVIQRILKVLSEHDISNSFFDRILKYIKDALGATYGKLYALVNTKDDFKAFANSLADGISKGMVIPLNSISKDAIKTMNRDSIKASSARFSLHGDAKRTLLRDLRKDLANNPKVNWEKVATGLIRVGRLTKVEADDLLHGWRFAKRKKLPENAALHAINKMPELLHLRDFDERHSQKVNQEMLQYLSDHIGDEFSEILKKVPSFKVRALIEEVMASGRTHPSDVLRELTILNEGNAAITKGTAGSARLLIATGIALVELRETKKDFQRIVRRTGDPHAADHVREIEEVMMEILRAAFINRSNSGASLGMGSKLFEFAGLTYEGVLMRVEELNKQSNGKARKNEVTQDEKDRLKDLVDEINHYDGEITKGHVAKNPEKKKRSEARKQWGMLRGKNAIKPTMTKEQAIEQLRRFKARNMKLSLALSVADPNQPSLTDIILSLTAAAHAEGVRGFNDIVKYIRDIEDFVTENDIYDAILATIPMHAKRAIDEIDRAKQVTKRHVRAIDIFEKMLTRQVDKMMDTRKAPADQDINDIGKLIKDIDRNIYDLDSEGDIYNQWFEALSEIRDKYRLAFTEVLSDQDTTDLLSDMIIATRMLKDVRTKDWLESRDKELDRQRILIKEKKYVELMGQEGTGVREFPTEMLAIEYEADGITPKRDADGELVTRKEPYDFGYMDRKVKDKHREIERVKKMHMEKPQDMKGWLALGAKKFRGTVGTQKSIFDLSYIGIQGMFLGLVTAARNPKVFKDALFSSLKVFKDEFRKDPSLANNIHKRVTEVPYYNIGIEMDLMINAPDAHVHVDEQISTYDWFDDLDDWLQSKKEKTMIWRGLSKVSGLRRKIKMASNLSFATYLNILSIYSFSNYYEKVHKRTGKRPTLREYKITSAQMNSATGRTKLGVEGEKRIKGASAVLWAPRLYLSQIKNVANLALDPIMLAHAAATGQKDKVRAYRHRVVNDLIFAGMMTGLYLFRLKIAELQCGEDAGISKDPDKSNWLKINCGEWSFDPSGNHRQWFRLGWGVLRSFDGLGPEDYYGNNLTVQDQVIQTFKYKWSPDLGLVYALYQGTDFLGREAVIGDDSPYRLKSRMKVMAEAMVPISVQNMIEIAKAEGIRGKPYMAAEAILGLGTTYISVKEKEERKLSDAKRDEKAEARAKELFVKQFGELDFDGEFQRSNVPYHEITPTAEHTRYHGGYYRIYSGHKRNSKQDLDYFIVRERQSGDDRGKKYFEWLDEEELPLSLIEE